MDNQKLLDEIGEHVKAIQSLLGIEETPSNKDTYKRIAKMYANELFQSRNDQNMNDLNCQIKVFPLEGSQSPITVSDVPFSSVCEHHWLPFIGTATVSYIPSDTIIGLSKIPRIIYYFSRRPQVQERFTSEVGKFLVSVLRPLELHVDVRAMHTCVQCRGIESPCQTHTSFDYNRSDDLHEAD